MLKKYRGPHFIDSSLWIESPGLIRIGLKVRRTGEHTGRKAWRDLDRNPVVDLEGNWAGILSLLHQGIRDQGAQKLDINPHFIMIIQVA